LDRHICLQQTIKDRTIIDRVREYIDTFRKEKKDKAGRHIEKRTKRERQTTRRGHKIPHPEPAEELPLDRF
jgi:hypothetical protein